MRPCQLWVSLFFFLKLTSWVENGALLSVINQQLALRHMPWCFQPGCVLSPSAPHHSAISTVVSNKDETVSPPTSISPSSPTSEQGVGGEQRRGAPTGIRGGEGLGSVRQRGKGNEGSGEKQEGEAKTKLQK